MLNKIIRFLEAGYGLLLLDSFEEKLGLSLAKAAADKAKLPLLTWSQPWDDTLGEWANPVRRPESAGAVGRTGSSGPAGASASDLTPIERRLFSEAVVEGPSKRQHIVYIAAIGDLPVELEREAGMVVLSPPRRGRATACSRKPPGRCSWTSSPTPTRWLRRAGSGSRRRAASFAWRCSPRGHDADHRGREAAPVDAQLGHRLHRAGRRRAARALDGGWARCAQEVARRSPQVAVGRSPRLWSSAAEGLAAFGRAAVASRSRPRPFRPSGACHCAG